MDKWIDRLSLLWATGFGSGLFPIAPGTVGTLVAYPIYWLARCWSSPAVIFALTPIAFLASIPACRIASKTLGAHDASEIGADEIVAMVMILCWVPENRLWQIAAFAAFRFFDIVKPWPIGWVDAHVAGGLGIMADDLIAAIYALAALFVAMRLTETSIG
jgi:phosphatidylglycerophosphatase A